MGDPTPPSSSGSAKAIMKVASTELKRIGEVLVKTRTEIMMELKKLKKLEKSGTLFDEFKNGYITALYDVLSDEPYTEGTE